MSCVEVPSFPIVFIQTLTSATRLEDTEFLLLAAFDVAASPGELEERNSGPSLRQSFQGVDCKMPETAQAREWISDSKGSKARRRKITSQVE